MYAKRDMQVSTELQNLLATSPLTDPQVIQDVKDFISAGEFALAFDTLCCWIFEDELLIIASYHERLTRVSKELGSEQLVERIRGLISS